MDKIYPLIEGKGEADAVPNLVTRILHEQHCFDVFVGEVQKANGKGNFTRDGGIERFVQRAQMWPDCSGILILMDADDECPLERALNFARRLESFGAKCPIALALANRDFENWFLASLESLRGQKFSDGRIGLKTDTPIPTPCENIESADEFLSKYFPPGINYKKSLDQIMFTRLLNIELTRSRSRSFERFHNAVDWLVAAIKEKQFSIDPHPLSLSERLQPVAVAKTRKAKRRAKKE